MKALRTKLSTYAIALLLACGFASPSMAGSGDFAGIYGALWASAGGAEISGTHTAGRNGDDAGENQDISRGQVGAVFPLAGYEIGFNLPLGDMFFLGVGHSWVQGVLRHGRIRVSVCQLGEHREYGDYVHADRSNDGEHLLRNRSCH